MRVFNHTPWPYLAFERRTAADERQLVVVARGVFELIDEQVPRALLPAPPLELADVFRGDPRTTSMRRDGALATFKPRSDIHLDAVARSPGGIARTDWEIAIAVGALTKQLRVVGPRAWMHDERGWTLGDIEPCTEVPLTWERAFGGAFVIDGERVADERNPLGTGFIPKGAPTDVPIPAPQVLACDEPAHRPGERYTPQGVAPVGRDSEWRLTHAGTYDAEWKRTRWPRLPDDFDYRFYNSAAPGLVTDGYLRGDERVELTNLTRSGRLLTVLPGLRWELDVLHGDDRFEVLPMHLDTLHLDVASLDPAEHRATLTWRACVAMPAGVTLVTLRAAREPPRRG